MIRWHSAIYGKVKKKKMSKNLEEQEQKNLQDLADRERAIAKRRAKKAPIAFITGIEFKRVILHMSGRVEGIDPEKEYGVRFVTEGRDKMFYPDHFDMDGDSFTLSTNLMCNIGEEPIASGHYYMVLFEVYSGHRKELKQLDQTGESRNVRRGDKIYRIKLDKDGHVVSKKRLTKEYPAYIAEGYEGELDNESTNPWNYKLSRGTGNHFFMVSAQDMDTAEFYFNVDYKPPKRPLRPDELRKKRRDDKRSKRSKKINEFKNAAFQWVFRYGVKHAKHEGNVILFCSGSRAEIGGNEEFIYKRMIERGLDKQFKFRFDFKESITTGHKPLEMIRFAYYLGSSDIILIDDYYPIIYKVDYPETTKVLQVWHACGAFKSLGFERLGKSGAPPFNTRVHKCYTHVPVSSEHSAKHHAEGFAISEDKFYPVGIPRTDIFFDEQYKQDTREKMFAEFPQCVGKKKVYLYAPTFRGDNALNARFPFDKFDLDRWGKFLEQEDSALIIKLHPFVKERVEIPEKYRDRIVDATDYREVNDILFIIDVLITDYSSIIYETSLLKKPMLFFAFDRRHYEATRDFYEPYEDLVPGKIVYDFDELLTAMKNEDYDYHKMDAFIKKNFKYTDGKATDRVIDQLILGKPAED